MNELENRLDLVRGITNNLIELLPPTQGECSRFSLRYDDNFTQVPRIVFSSSIKMWNIPSLDLRNSISLLKQSYDLTFFLIRIISYLIILFLDRHPYFIYVLDWVIVLWMPIFLKLTLVHLLNVDVNCKKMQNETVKHFFLFCLLFAAQRARLVTFVAQLYGEHWSQN